MERECLQKYYSQHHKDKKRLGFIYGGVERAGLLARWVDKGKRVLDISCRDDALISYYVAGNTVVGVDMISTDIKAARQYYHEREAQRRTQHEAERQQWVQRVPQVASPMW